MSESENNAEEPYVVTRGKPPREHQFRKGQSGNPRGRPKGSKQISALIDEELDRKMEVTLRGRRTKLPKRQIMVRQLVDRALQGDHKAIATCLAIQGARGGAAGKGAAQPSTAEEFDASMSNDEQILLEFFARHSKASAEATTAADDVPAGEEEQPVTPTDTGGDDEPSW
jgi:hypothetical protein